MKRVFLDANILLDYIDEERTYYKESLDCVEYLLANEIEIHTSCDIITTIYYISGKRGKKRALESIREINKFCHVIEFSNNEVEDTCHLMLQDSDYNDLEDTLQYILAKKLKCDMIISNDSNFVSKDITLVKSANFIEEFKIK